MKTDDTFAKVSELYYSYDNYLRAKMVKNNLGNLMTSHGRILVALKFDGDMTMSEMSNKIHKQPQTTTTLVKKLVAYKYIEIYSLKDKRVKYLKLTDKGREVTDTILDISGELYQTQYKGISEEEVTCFRGILKTIMENLKEGED